MTRSTFAAIGAPIATVPRLVHESFSPGSFIWFRQKVLPMARRRKNYEGKDKILYEGPDPGTRIQYFNDAATAYNAQKRGRITRKGVLNTRSQVQTSELQSLLRHTYAYY